MYLFFQIDGTSYNLICGNSQTLIDNSQMEIE